MRNPYQVDWYAENEEDAPRGMRGAISRMKGMVGCLFAMAALFLGTIYVLWRASGR